MAISRTFISHRKKSTRTSRRPLRHVGMSTPEGEGENREWTLMDAKGGTPMRTGVDSFAVPTDGMFPPRQRRTMR